MLSDDIREEIEHAAAESPVRSAAAIDALRIVQRHHGWIADEHLHEVAALLGMSATELDGIATFYSQLFRRPVGRHVVQACDSVVCWMLEQSAVVAQLERLGLEMGKTTGDGRFTLLPVQCLGACHHAPAMLIDGELHEGLTPENVEALLARYP
jgi:NADH-quinone oxidoreductase subunit E